MDGIYNWTKRKKCTKKTSFIRTFLVYAHNYIVKYSKHASNFVCMKKRHVWSSLDYKKSSLGYKMRKDSTIRMSIAVKELSSTKVCSIYSNVTHIYMMSDSRVRWMDKASTGTIAHTCMLADSRTKSTCMQEVIPTYFEAYRAKINLLTFEESNRRGSSSL